MKILSVFPDFPWLNKSCFLITHTLTWKNPFQLFFLTTGTSIRRVSEYFWWNLLFVLSFTSFPLIIWSRIWNSYYCQINGTRYHIMRFYTTWSERKNSSQDLKILLLPSAVCDCILAQEQSLTKCTRLCWSYSPTKGLSSELSFQGSRYMKCQLFY